MKDLSTAAILFYRTIELVQQHILAKKYNIVTDKADYRALSEKINIKLVEKRFKDIHKKLMNYEKELPTKIGLIDGAILLKVLNESAYQDINLEKLKKVISVRNMVTREHGLSSVTEDNLRSLRDMSKKILEKAYQIYKPINSPNLNELKKHLTYPYEEL